MHAWRFILFFTEDGGVLVRDTQISWGVFWVSNGLSF
jgi:hypothetical protein